MKKTDVRSIALFFITVILAMKITAQNSGQNRTPDDKVRRFLNEHQGKWHDMNIPESDGRLLYDLIIKNNYKSALEIGTSTGHSGIWIAWALSKTGGKLVTIEIDEDRYKTALENFSRAGLSDYIDARLGDAHKIVKEIKGPFDFVFSDADKEWYKNYFTDIEPKLKVGGCFTAHNVYESSTRRSLRASDGQAVFLDYVKSLKNYETTVDSRGGGVSISYKKSEK